MLVFAAISPMFPASVISGCSSVDSLVEALNAPLRPAGPHKIMLPERYVGD